MNTSAEKPRRYHSLTRGNFARGFRFRFTASSVNQALELHSDGRVPIFDSSDDRVVRASTSGAVDSGLIPSRVKPKTLNLVFTACLLDAQH